MIKLFFIIDPKVLML